MNSTSLKLDGLKIIQNKVMKDERGYFYESYNKKKNDEVLNNINFVQHNESFSKKGVIRGLHFQKPPYAQSKLIRCVNGSILDIALDLRLNSKTYGKFESIVLSSVKKNQLFIPKGFAHGFIVLSSSALISYQVDNYYNKKYESGVIWNDPDLKIDWKLDENEIMVSEKDKNLPFFRELVSPFL